MCGILCKICYSGSNEKLDDALKKRLTRRGPDADFQKEIIVTDDIKLLFYGTLLWMQGPVPSSQIHENEYGILLYNGDIFDKTWDRRRCDTDVIMHKLTMNDNLCTETHIIKILTSLKGPFSIIYFDKINNNIYFTRDRIGRNSLLVHRGVNNIVISSVLDRNYNCVEVPATHLFKLNIITQKIKTYMWETCITEEYDVKDWLVKVEKQESLSDFNCSFNFITPMDLDEGDEVVEYILNVANQHANKKLIILHHLLKHPIIHRTVETLISLLEKSVKMRVQTQPHMCKICIISLNRNCDHCTVGILFSGGLDSSILAVLAHKYLSLHQSIHLINVGFENDNCEAHEVPDRLTSRQSHNELQLLCPTRRWLFLDIDVEEEDKERYKKEMIADLVHPRKTVLDVSLGTVLWFASRSARDVSPHSSSCRIVLLGSGADELFGGYTRHRNAFKRHGWSGLSKEMQLDWLRISFRNLARDNRVISDNGRQPRMPYLDDTFTEYVLSLKPWLRSFPSEKLGPGLGDKLILRLVAFKLGLREVATFPKRAMQFGTRIANKKENGADISELFK